MSEIVSEAEVVDALARAGTTIPAAYYLGTAKHESGFDLRNVTPEGNGTTSIGLYQVNASEQREAGVSGSLTDLDVNTAVFVYLAERNRSRIRDAVGLNDSDPDPWDMGAYLALAHNQGIGAALQTLANYPTGDPTYLGWNRYKTDNNCLFCHCIDEGICSYGDDCLYSPETGAPLVTRSAGLGFLASGAFLFFTFGFVRFLVRRHMIS